MDHRANEIARVAAMLDDLLARDPQQALDAARQLRPTPTLTREDIKSLQAAFFVDAGTDLKEMAAVREGVDLLRDLASSHPERLDLTYNLANGLSELASGTPHKGMTWHLDTSSIRREARSLFESVAQARGAESLGARARTNQANLLRNSYRWAEAYDRYLEALSEDSTNSIASSGAAKLLAWLADRQIGSPRILRGVAARLAAMAKETEGFARLHSGTRVAQALEGLPDEIASDWNPDLSGVDDYMRFVADHRLALAATIAGVNPSLKRWDGLEIESIREKVGTSHGVPPIFAMFNGLKADFLAARWVAFQALSDGAPESGTYADTLDYAIYGASHALLVLAHRSAIDILDRIAVAASDYLQLPGNAQSIAFPKRWHVFEKGKLKEPLEWQPQVAAEINSGNTALLALTEMALDITAGGFLNPQKTLRNSSTHRFVVLHDLSSAPSRESEYVEHFKDEEFAGQTVTALQLVRAALLYFVEMIALRERRLGESGGLTVPLEVPQHHWVRGEDE